MRVRQVLRAALATLTTFSAAGASCSQSSLPAIAARTLNAHAHATDLERRIEAQPVCIGSTVASAGELSDALYYRAKRLPDGRIAVGYYAFFSDERPWGNNWLTWSVVPALALDLFYTRSFFVGPGYQRFAYGKGDVEGVRVVFRAEGDGLDMEYAVADDGGHVERFISRDEALGLAGSAPGTLHFYTDVWSHQLGGSSARRTSDLVYSKCYARGSVLPLPASVATGFRLRRRAKPASLDPAFATIAAGDLGTGPMLGFAAMGALK